MFSMQPKGLFGQRRQMGQGILPGDQPDYGMGDFPPTPQGMPHNLPQNANAGKKRKGLFGTGIQLSDVIGIAGDAVAINRGMEPMFAAQNQREREHAAKLREESLKRAQSWEDKVRWHEYELANPKPVNNDTINDFNWYKNLSPQDREIYHRMKPQYMTVDNGDGTKSIIPIGPNGPVMGGAAARPVQQSDWDSAKPMGGGAPSGTGMFP